MNNKKRRRVIITLTIVLFVLAITACFFAWPEYREYIRDVQYRTAPIGSTVKLGKYEQDGNLKNGPEDIKWIVLVREDNRILIISQYSLLSSPYITRKMYWEHDHPYWPTWEESEARRILNEEFYYMAFLEKERERIMLSFITTDNQPSTEDAVFLLSEQEVQLYFSSDNDRRCTTTRYVAERDDLKSKSRLSDWWLRTLADTSTEVGESYVGASGAIENTGYGYTGQIQLRPAIWLYID